jgi:hypothetical protein
MAYRFGWVPDAEAQREFQASLPWGSFTEAIGEGPEAEGDALLYRCVAKCMGLEKMPARNQGSIGSCVGHGTATSADVTTAVEIVLKGEAEEWFAPVAADAMYGASRQIANQLGSWEGSNGSWAAKAITDYGTLHMTKYGDVDLTTYRVDQCRQFQRKGLSAELKAKAAEHKMGAAAPVRSAEEARQALVNGYGINVCSNQGFSGRRDSDGVMKAQGSWAHSMAIIAYLEVNGRKLFKVQNSWGAQWGSGPQVPDDSPDGSFNAEWSVIDRMCRGGDTYCYSAFDGFERRSLWDFLRIKEATSPSLWGFMRG